MEEFVFEPEEENIGEEGTTEDGIVSSEEEGFMKGYTEEDEVPACEECGSAIHSKPIKKIIDGEEHIFCCDACAREFEESLGEN